MNTTELLNERGKTHGDFSDNAQIAQAIKHLLRQGKNWEARTDVEREAMEMIAHKLARWVSAPNYHSDNPTDIAGYATLVVERMTTRNLALTPEQKEQARQNGFAATLSSFKTEGVTFSPKQIETLRTRLSNKHEDQK